MIDHLHGISTYQQLLAAGLGKDAIAARVERRELEHVRYSLYRHPFAAQDERQRVAIGLLAVEGSALATSACGLRLQGHVVKGREHHADIVVPHGTSVADDLRWVEYRRSSHLDVVEPVEVEGLVTVPAWWGFGDLARDVVDQALAETVARSVGARRITVEELEVGMHRRGKFPGRRRLRRVIAALRSDLPFSRAEREAARRLRRAGVDVRLQHEVTVDGGVTYRLDLAVPDLQINIEIDGPHHWLPAQATSDRRRDRDLREIDWLVVRYSVYEIDRDPEAFVTDVLRLVAKRRMALAGRRAA